MPIITPKDYEVPLMYKSMHINTITAALLRKVKNIESTKKRILTPDHDFYDVEWSTVLSKKLLIVLHGLEGHACKPYMRGMMKLFNLNGYDAVGLHHRGCSGTDNLLLRGYTSGFTGDLRHFVKEIEFNEYYEEIVICGFSAGGNIALRYAGQEGNEISTLVKKVIAISAPIDLYECSYELDKAKNKIYLKQFLFTMKQKARMKYKKFPNSFDIKKAIEAKTFKMFDDAYTSIVWGYKDANEFWKDISSIHVLDKISVPTLIINAKDDSFLAENCYPKELAKKMDNLYLMLPKYGGHLGFMSENKDGFLWSELQALKFATN
jgi:uncharacterized protein